MWQQRVVAFCLACTTVFLFVTPVSAKGVTQPKQAPQKEQWVQQITSQQKNNTAPLAPGEVALTGQGMRLAPNKYSITLDIDSQGRVKETPPTDSVLLLESSFAARDTGVLQENIAAAEAYIQQRMAEGSPHRMSIVTCGAEATVLQGLTQSKEELLLALGRVTPSGGLYLDEGLRVAGGLLHDASREREIILFSSGDATYSQRVTTATANPYCTQRCEPLPVPEGYALSWNFAVAYHENNQRIGSTSGPSTGVLGNAQMYQINPCNQGNGRHVWRGGHNRYPRYHGDVAMAVADALWGQGIVLAGFAAGAEGSVLGQEAMEYISRGKIAYAPNYADLLESLAPTEETPALGQGVLHAYRSEIYQIDSTSFWCSEGTILHFTEDTGQLAWELGNQTKAQLRFTVLLGVEGPWFQQGEAYPLFTAGEFSYENEQGKPASLAVPQLSFGGEYSTLYKAGVWVNAEGKYLNPAGNPVNTPEEAKIIATPVPILNQYAVNQWGITPEFLVPSDGLTAQKDYIPHPDGGPMPIEVAEVGTTQTVFFPYVQTNLSYDIQYYYQGESTPFDTITLTNIDFNSPVTNLPDSSLLLPGFERIGGGITPPTIVAPGVVYHVIYQAKASDFLPYSVEYYQDNFLFETEEGAVFRGDPIILVEPRENRYLGYTLEKIMFDGQEDGVALRATITQEKNRIAVHYSKDTAATLPYQIQEYLDGHLTNTVDYSVWKGDTTVTIRPHGTKYPGYILQQITFGGDSHPREITGVVTETQQTFSVEYQSNLQDTLPYWITYFLDGKETETVPAMVWAGDPVVVISPPPDKYPQASLGKILFNGQEHESSLRVEITPQHTVIQVYYDTPSPQQLPYHVEYYHDGALQRTEDYTVDAANPEVWVVAPEADPGFLLDKITFGKQQEKQTIQGTITLDENTFCIYYSLDTTDYITYTVEFFFDSDFEYYATQNILRGANTVTRVPDPDRFGYRLEATVPALPTPVDNGGVIKAYYTVDNSIELAYKIRYHKEGELVASATEHGKVTMGNPALTITPDPHKFAGYLLEYIEFGGDSHPSSITGEITPGGAVFNVYYKADTPASFTYRVEYAYDGVVDASKTEQITVPAHASTIAQVPDKLLSGYRWATPEVLPTLPLTITDNLQIITKFYEQVPVDPTDPPDPPLAESTVVELLLDFYKLNHPQGSKELALRLPIEQEIKISDYIGQQNFGGMPYELYRIVILQQENITPFFEEPTPKEAIQLGQSCQVLGASGALVGQESAPTVGEPRIAPRPGNQRYELNIYDHFTFYKGYNYQVSALFRLTDFTPETGETPKTSSKDSRATERERQDTSPLPLFQGTPTVKPTTVAKESPATTPTGGGTGLPRLPQTGGFTGYSAPPAAVLNLAVVEKKKKTNNRN